MVLCLRFALFNASHAYFIECLFAGYILIFKHATIPALRPVTRVMYASKFILWNKDFAVTEWSCFKHNNEEQPLWWRWEEGGGTTWLKNSIVGGSVRGAACLLLPPCRTVEAAALPSPHPSFNSPLYEQKFSLTFHISFYWAPLCSSSPANGRMFYLIHRLTNKKAGRNAFIFLYYIKYVCRILCFWLSAESWNCFAHRLESGACA